MAETTQQRILDAAMNSFAQSGYAATSVRHIVGTANVNIASVNYHFGSKEDLFFAILDEPFTALAAERKQRLEAITVDTPAVEEIVRAFIEPLRSSGSARRSLFFVGPMLARVLHEAPELKQRAIETYFVDTRCRFVAALARIFPTAPEREVDAAFFLMVSALIGGICPPNTRPGQASSLSAKEQCLIVERLVRFVSAGISAQLGEWA